MNTNEDGHRINDQSFMQGMTVQIRNCSVAWRGIMSCEYIFDPSGVNMQFSDHLFSRTDARTNFVGILEFNPIPMQGLHRIQIISNF